MNGSEFASSPSALAPRPVAELVGRLLRAADGTLLRITRGDNPEDAARPLLAMAIPSGRQQAFTADEASAILATTLREDEVEEFHGNNICIKTQCPLCGETFKPSTAGRRVRGTWLIICSESDTYSPAVARRRPGIPSRSFYDE